jgi:magnesium transporter
LDPLSDAEAAQVITQLNPAIADDVLLAMDDERRQAVIAAAPTIDGQQWSANLSYPEESVGRLMEAPRTVFPPEINVGETINRIRELAKSVLVTYGYVVDSDGRLQGVVAMRDLLLAERGSLLRDIMLRNPFTLSPDAKAIDAMRRVVNHHFPVYPVCTSDGHLVGIVRGAALFAHHAYEISAQAGTMVGVEKEERLSTPWFSSLRLRHPWLQLNLLTAFIAAGVVGLFQSTLDQFVILALFLPVLAGQSGNTGCQSLAVALRGLTLGELRPGRERALVAKEGFLGLLNGALVGLTAGIGMCVTAWYQGNANALKLGVIVFVSMIAACVVSGVAGATIPLILRRMGADPATASSIFITTASDVASMGFFLALATIWLV